MDGFVNDSAKLPTPTRPLSAILMFAISVLGFELQGMLGEVVPLKESLKNPGTMSVIEPPKVSICTALTGRLPPEAAMPTVVVLMSMVGLVPVNVGAPDALR